MTLIYFLSFFLILTHFGGCNESKSSPSIQNVLSNSFEENYKIKKPNLIYLFNIKNQIHDYSNNWDIDGDEIKDNIYFVGNGGAHLFYHLQVILSSTQKKYVFSNLEIDFPFFFEMDDLCNNDSSKYEIQFSVGNFDLDIQNEIYLNLKNDNMDLLKDLESAQIIIDYLNKDLIIKNFNGF